MNMKTLREETQLGYQIDRAYEMADRYAQGSDKWHKWMDEAKRLTDELHGRLHSQGAGEK